jgi:hypothetical protein
MTADAPATGPAKREPLTAEQTAGIMAKLAVIHADILDLDERVTLLDIKHHGHISKTAK